jgi:hypothetical protein
MNWKECGRKLSWINLSYHAAFDWTDRGKIHKISARIVGVPTGI